MSALVIMTVDLARIMAEEYEASGLDGRATLDRLAETIDEERSPGFSQLFDETWEAHVSAVRAEEETA